MKRELLSLPFLLLLLPLHAWSQNTTHNYILSETFLRDDGSASMRSVQYFDGLGRPTMHYTNSLGQQGLYVCSMTEYDLSGRDSVKWLPVPVGMSADGLSDLPVLSEAYYGDAYAYSVTNYDALDRPLRTTTPGEAWNSHNKAKTISYVTNHNDDVKHYTTADLSSDTFNEDGYYTAGMLTGETASDEDNHWVTTYKDRRGNVVLERRSSGNSMSHADHGYSDTYYVYAPNGLIRFVLTPEYQMTGLANAVYTYKYDSRNRCTEKVFPGCSPIRYTYDHGDRPVITQDGLLRERGLYRFTLCDIHGRPALQGTCTAYALNAERNAIVRFNASATGIGDSGYELTDDSAITLENVTVESATYYDHHVFLTHASFTNSNDIGDLSSAIFPPTGTETNAIGYKTGERIATTDGQSLYATYYYDRKGQCIDERHSLLEGGVRKVFTSYSFTGKPETVTEVFSKRDNSDYTVTTHHAYDIHNDQPTTTTVTYGNSGAPHVVSQLAYNDLGQVINDRRTDISDDIDYAYNLQGWTTAIESRFLTEQLRYTDGSGYPRYAGDISSLLWQSSDSILRGYKFTYHPKGMMQSATYGEGPVLSLNKNRYNENINEFTPNGAISKMRRRGRTNAGTYAPIDDLEYSYDGPRVTSISDGRYPLSYNGAFEYRDRHSSTLSPDFTYNTAGLLTSDRDKGISRITYNNIGLTDSICFDDGTVIRYVYSLTGEKLRVTRSIQLQTTIPTPDQPGPIPITTTGEKGEQEGPTDLSEGLLPTTGQGTLIPVVFEDTYYCGDYLTMNGIDGTAAYYFDGGYIQMPPQNQMAQPQYYYYTRDHLGNVRSVATKNPETNVVEEVQQTHYYPFGGIIADISWGRDVQKRLYNSKELDASSALYWYDYGARQYDATRCQFTGPDPLAEKYYPWNAWMYCLNNPIKYVDPDGRSTWVVAKGDGKYEVIGGDLTDKDYNIYVYTKDDNGEYTVRGESIGVTPTLTSFYNSDNKAWATGAVLNPKDNSGKDFLQQFFSNSIPLGEYMDLARTNHKYDFKSSNGIVYNSSRNIYRGTVVGKNSSGQAIYASARDVGNIAAGYIAAANGISWIATRMAFDLYQSKNDKKFSIEGVSSQQAQFLGWIIGRITNPPKRQNANALKSALYMPYNIYNFFKRKQ